MKESAVNRQRSLKHLLFGYLAVAIVVFLIVGYCSLYMVQDLYVKQTAKDLEARARLCARPIADLLRQENVGAIDVLCKELGGEVHTRITVIRPDGQVIGDTDEDPQRMENHADRPEIGQAIEEPGVVGRSTRYSTTLEETLMYRAVALQEDGATVAVVRTSIPITTLEERLDVAYRAVGTAGLIGVLVIVCVMPWFSIRMTRLTTEAKHRVVHDDQSADELADREDGPGSAPQDTTALN